MTRLVLLHGRDLDGQDPQTIESGWLSALGAGFAAAGSPLRLHDADADFVYYGDTLEHLVTGGAGARPPITTDAVSAPMHPHDLAALPAHELRFLLAVARDVLADAGVTPPAEADAVLDVAALDVTARRPDAVEPASRVLDLVREALVRVLALLDAIPGLSAAVILLFVRDVYTYLHDDTARSTIDAGVDAALPDDGSAVVVAHSLGSVIAYSVLARRAAAGLEVPLLVTMGCPLGIRAIRETFAERGPLAFPPGVRRWVNARDERDLLALHGLASSFPPASGPARVTDLDVDNEAPGHHSAAVVLDDGETWTGYLATPGVAREIARELAPVS